jgi:pantothenate synthetase
VYLSAEDRARALALPRALRALTEGVPLAEARAMLADVEVDYFEIVDSRTFRPSANGDLACGAIRVGPTRLIDNARLR